MNLDIFEKQILNKNLRPFEVICGKGGRVKWFLCLDNRPNREYALIVYDEKGKALVLTEYHEEITLDTIFNILPYPGGVKINGYIPMRDSRLDLVLPMAKSSKSEQVKVIDCSQGINRADDPDYDQDDCLLDVVFDDEEQ